MKFFFLKLRLKQQFFVLQNAGTLVAQESADELRNFSLLKSLKTRIGMGSPLVGGDLVATTPVYPRPFCWERT
jgi:hypothetical protein